MGQLELGLKDEHISRLTVEIFTKKRCILFGRVFFSQCHVYHPHDWEWYKHTTYKNGDDSGMVYDIVLTTLQLWPFTSCTYNPIGMYNPSYTTYNQLQVIKF